MDGDTPNIGNGDEEPRVEQAPDAPSPEPAATPEPPVETPTAEMPAAETPTVEPATAAAEPPKRRRRRLTILAAVLAGLFLIVGGALAGILFVLRGTGDVLVGHVPDDALVYATAYLDPSASQKLNLEELLRKFPALADKDLGEQVNGALDEAFAANGMDFHKDVEPWLGTQVGFFVTTPSSLEKDPGGALLVSTTDDGAAEDALTKLQHDGGNLSWETSDHNGTTIHTGTAEVTGFGGDISPSTVWAVADGVAVVGSDQATVEAVIDAPNASMGDSEDYQATVGALPDDRLGTLYVNVPAYAHLLKTDPSLGTAFSITGGGDALKELGSIQGVGVAVWAESDGLGMRLVAKSATNPGQTAAGSPHSNAVLGWAPPDSYGVMASTGLGDSIDQLISSLEQAQPGFREGATQLGLTDALKSLSGDFGVVVNPRASSEVPGGALLMAVNDPEAMRTFLDRLAQIIQLQLASSSFGSSGPGGGQNDFGTSPLSFHAPVMSAGWKTEDYQGVQIRYLDLPQLTQEEGLAPTYAVADDMAFIATSPDEAKALIDASKGDNVTSSSNFEAAMKHADDQSPGMWYVNLESIIQAVAKADPYGGQEIATQLAPLKAFVMSSAPGEDTGVVDMFLLID